MINRNLLERDKTLLFRQRNIVESALYVKTKWGTIYGVSGMRYGRKGCEWLQKEGSRWDLGIPGPDRTAIHYTLKPVLQLRTDRILISKVVAPGRAT